MKKIIITGCSSPNYWYLKSVGRVLNANDNVLNHPVIEVHIDGELRAVEKQDCEEAVLLEVLPIGRFGLDNKGKRLWGHAYSNVKTIYNVFVGGSFTVMSKEFFKVIDQQSEQKPKEEKQRIRILDSVKDPIYKDYAGSEVDVVCIDKKGYAFIHDYRFASTWPLLAIKKKDYVIVNDEKIKHINDAINPNTVFDDNLIKPYKPGVGFEKEITSLDPIKPPYMNLETGEYDFGNGLTNVDIGLLPSASYVTTGRITNLPFIERIDIKSIFEPKNELSSALKLNFGQPLKTKGMIMYQTNKDITFSFQKHPTPKGSHFFSNISNKDGVHLCNLDKSINFVFDTRTQDGKKAFADSFLLMGICMQDIKVDDKIMYQAPEYKIKSNYDFGTIDSELNYRGVFDGNKFYQHGDIVLYKEVYYFFIHKGEKVRSNEPSYISAHTPVYWQSIGIKIDYFQSHKDWERAIDTVYVRLLKKRKKVLEKIIGIHKVKKMNLPLDLPKSLKEVTDSLNETYKLLDPRK